MTDIPLVEDFATDWDHSDPQWVADPYPIFARFRAESPVHWVDRWGCWLLTRSEDIDATIALIDRALALNPSSARGWHTSGAVRVYAGKPDVAIGHS